MDVSVVTCSRRPVHDRPLRLDHPTPTGHVQRAPSFETTPRQQLRADTEVRPYIANTTVASQSIPGQSHLQFEKAAGTIIITMQDKGAA